MKLQQTSSTFRRLVGRLLVLGFFLSCLIGWLYADLGLTLMRTNRPYIYEAGYRLPEAKLVQASALNYRTAAADLVWVDGVQFVAKSMMARQSADAVTDYAETLIALDPYFYKVYSWHSAARMLAVGYPSPADIEAANDVLEEGMRWFPDAWQLPYEAAANYIGFNEGVDDRTRIAQLTRGIQFAEAGAAMPQSPEVLASLALSFRARRQYFERKIELENKQPDESTSALQTIEAEKERDAQSLKLERDMLIHLYSLATSEQARESVLSRLERIGGSDALVARLKSHRDMQRKWHQGSSLDYLPFDLFSLVEKPPNQPQ